MVLTARNTVDARGEWRHVAPIKLEFSTHFLRRLTTDILQTFPPDVAITIIEATLCRFP